MISHDDFEDIGRELMLKVQSGDSQAFRKLFDHYKVRVMAFASHILVHHQSQVEEAVQEAFFKVYRSRETYDPTARFSTWLWTIVRNECFDRLKKKSTKNEASYQDPVEFESDADYSSDFVAGSNAFDHQQSPEDLWIEHTLEKAQAETIERCMKGLNDKQRQALILRCVNELSYDEISVELGLSLSSTKTAIFRAKESLTKCVKSCMSGVSGDAGKDSSQ